MHFKDLLYQLFYVMLDVVVELVGVSLKEEVVTGSYTGEANSVAPRGDSPTVGRP